MGELHVGLDEVGVCLHHSLAAESNVMSYTRTGEEENQQDGERLVEKVGEEVTGVAEKGEPKGAPWQSRERTSFDKREFLLKMVIDLKADPVADAGVRGDLNTLTWAASGRGGENAERFEGKEMEDD